MSSVLFDPTLQGLAQALTLHQRRHEVLASNLANVETPGFRARELDFQQELRQAFEATTDPEPVRGQVVPDPSAPPRADGNTVDLDQQMAKLNANGTGYLALARILGHRLSMLRQAIEGNR